MVIVTAENQDLVQKSKQLIVPPPLLTHLLNYVQLIIVVDFTVCSVKLNKIIRQHPEMTK